MRTNRTFVRAAPVTSTVYLVLAAKVSVVSTIGFDVIAGVVLGSLAMRTRSIYSGFLVHVTVALSMDLLTLANHGTLPRALWG